MKAIFLGFRARLVLVLLITTVIGVGTYFMLATDLLRTDKLNYAYDVNGAMARIMGAEVEVLLRTTSDLLRFVAAESDDHIDELSPSAKQFFQTNPSVLRLQVGTISESGHFEKNAEIADTRRLKGPFADVDLSAVDPAFEPFFARLLSEGVVVANTSIEPDVPIMTLGVADENGRAVIANMKLDPLLEVFNQHKLVTAFIVDSRGRVIAHPDPEKVIAREDLSKNPFVAQAIKGTFQRGVAQAGETEASVGAYSRIGTAGLIVVSEVPLAKALAPLDVLTQKSALFAVAVILLCIIVAVFLSRGLIAPIRRLEEATEQIARGDYQLDIQVKGPSELEALGAAFNKMGAEVEAREDAIRRGADAERAEARLRELVSSLPYAIAVVVGDESVFANDTCTRSLGFESQQLERRSIFDFVAEKSEQHLAALLSDEIEGESFEHTMVGLDGTEWDAELAVVEHRYDGEPAKLLVFRDISELKSLRDRIRHSERMASVGTLAAGVSHEINNPLAYILANQAYVMEQAAEVSNLIDSRLGLAEDSNDRAFREVGAALDGFQEILSDAQEGAERVGSIVKSLKSFARAGDQNVTTVDVRAAIESTLPLAHNEIRHSAELKVDLGDVPLVRGDASRLGQVVLNLLVNAAQSIEVIARRMRFRSRPTRLPSVSSSRFGIPGAVYLPA